MSFNLTAEQAAIVSSTEPIRVVIADAGTAKTTVLVEAIAHDIISGVPASEVLALTFSNGGAQILRERVQSRAPNAAAATIATIHAVCLSLVRQDPKLFGFETAPAILEEWEQRSIFKRELSKLDIFENELVDQFTTAYSWARNKRLDTNAIARKVPIELAKIEVVCAAYSREKAFRNKVDFEDVLVLVASKIKASDGFRESLRKRISSVYVDESQDTSLLQWEIVLPIAKRLLAVGDPKQSIYGWRGGVNDFERLIAGGVRFTMHRNFRSSPEILDVANAVYPTGIHSHHRHGHKPVLLGYDDAVEEAVGIVRLVKEQSALSIAVLARNWDQLELVNLALMLAGFSTSIDIKQYAEKKRLMENFVALLLWTCGGRGDTLWQRCLQAVGKDEVSSFEYPADSGLFTTPLDLVPLTAFERGIFDAANDLDFNADSVPGGINVFYEKVFGPKLDPCGKLEMSVQILARMVGNIADLHVLFETERTLGSVVVSTIHGQKGAEFDLVFLIGLNEGSLPLWNAEDLIEERNLFYVGVTRAKRLLFLSRPFVDHKGRYRDRSSFLDELNLDLFSLEPPAPEAAPVNQGDTPHYELDISIPF